MRDLDDIGIADFFVFLKQFILNLRADIGGKKKKSVLVGEPCHDGVVVCRGRHLLRMKNLDFKIAKTSFGSGFNLFYGDIFAFEPGPRQRELLEMTVDKNHLKEKITVYSDGLGKIPGKAIFYTHDSKNIAHDGLIDTGRVGESRAIEVNITTFDDWWTSQNFPKVTVVKIDTEGAELWILQGAVKMLAGASPVLYLEIEPKNLRVYPHNHFNILAFLCENHYRLFTLKGVEITKENFNEYIGVEDTYVARIQNRSGN